jgi:hypothetical protein
MFVRRDEGAQRNAKSARCARQRAHGHEQAVPDPTPRVRNYMSGSTPAAPRHSRRVLNVAKAFTNIPEAQMADDEEDSRALIELNCEIEALLVDTERTYSFGQLERGELIDEAR